MLCYVSTVNFRIFVKIKHMYKLEFKGVEDKYYNSLYNLSLDNPKLWVSK